jgi:hypothetical protein
MKDTTYADQEQPDVAKKHGMVINNWSLFSAVNASAKAAVLPSHHRA